jgi:hypothetical protein
MKSDHLYGGGDSKAPEAYYFNGISLRVTSGANFVHLTGTRQGKSVVRISISHQEGIFNVFISEDSLLDVEHLYAIERLLQSYALTFGFSILQIVLPIYGALQLNSVLEFSGEFEKFPLMRQ